MRHYILSLIHVHLCDVLNIFYFSRKKSFFDHFSLFVTLSIKSSRFRILYALQIASYQPYFLCRQFNYDFNIYHKNLQYMLSESILSFSIAIFLMTNYYDIQHAQPSASRSRFFLSASISSLSISSAHSLRRSSLPFVSTVICAFNTLS